VVPNKYCLYACKSIENEERQGHTKLCEVYSERRTVKEKRELLANLRLRIVYKDKVLTLVEKN